MKKTVFTSVLFSASLVIQAQFMKPASTPTVVTDTLHYYLNKYYFKTGNGNKTTYPYFRTDATATVASTAITYCCTKFDVPAGETVTVTGLEGLAQRDPSYVNPTIPIKLYLFKLNPSTGLPVMPPIDSVTSNVGGLTATTPSMVGDNFTNPLTLAARVMTTSFAVAIRNEGTSAGDYVQFMRTASLTRTNTTSTAADQYGEGNGSVRFNGVFYNTRDFNMIAGFGPGTDYEFMVAPRVSYKIQASQFVPPFVYVEGDPSVPDTICVYQGYSAPFTFTNTSSKFYEHPQYNLNHFYRKWNLYSPFPTNVSGVFSSDSSLTWYFEFYDADPAAGDPRVVLPYVNTGTISVSTRLSYYPYCFTTNQFKARLKPMSPYGRGRDLKFDEGFKICLRDCIEGGVGKNGVLINLKLYPNPVINGKTQISNLEGRNTVEVYNIMGQLVYTLESENPTLEIDLSSQPKGAYFVKIQNTARQTRTLKILNQD